MPTELVFREDAYRTSCEASVVSVNEHGGILLDRTVFFAAGGGQPGDSGVLRFADGREIEVATAVPGDEPDEVFHMPATLDVLAEPAREVVAQIAWARRYRLMRIHTCLHLLSVAVPYPVTGGQIAEEYGRLDFDAEDARLDKEGLTEEINALIAADHPITTEWITDEELEAKPELVKTMAVKPPRGQGQVRLVRIGDIDLQPCGGTHVRTTGEIGAVTVTRVESKGARNRRVRIALAED